MRKFLAILLVTGVTIVTIAGVIKVVPPAAEADKTFDDYWKEASHAPGAVKKDYLRATVIIDEKNLTTYIFTKPGDPAHPGVIVRKLVTEKDGTYMDTHGRSDGPDSAQSAFKAWMNNPFN